MLGIAFAFVLVPAPVVQEPGATADVPIPEAIREAAYLHSEARATLLALCDGIGARMTGSEGYDRAAAWARERFAAHGLDARLDAFTFPHAWTRGPARARIVAPIERDLAILASGWSPPTDGTVRAKLTLDRVGEGIVLVDPAYAPLVASRKPPCPNATLALVDAQRPYALVPTGLATWAKPFEPGAIPSAFVAAEDAALLRRLAANGPVELEVTIGASFAEQGTTADVLADLKGRESPDDIVLAVAHLDSWDTGPGALDDAAGCAVLIEAARILAALPDRPKRTIRFALLAGVEQGLGTAGYVSRRGADELAHHVGGFAIEGGGGRLFGVMLAGHEEVLPRAEAWFAPVKDLGVTDIGFRTSLRRLPQALQDAGVPVFAMVEAAPELPIVTGSRADTPDKVLELNLMQAATVLAQGLWARADA